MIRAASPHLSPRLRTLAAGLLFLLALGVVAGLLPRGELESRATASVQTPEPQLVAPIDPRRPLPAEAAEWVEATLAGMSLEERVGQTLMVRAFGEFYPSDSETRRDLVALVQELALAGVVLFRSEAYGAAALVDDLQEEAARAGRLPLLVAADFEWGADFRIEGAVSYPTTMAVGATGEPEAAAWMGRATARDARALGIHWIFAPVADVNVNPLNPVINVRAFGEDPAAVAAMVSAFIEGAQEGGVLATAKHFPGHGDTAVDSHISLPILPHDRERLEAVELMPFRAAVDSGVASVMTAHMAVPALTEERARPATLSQAVLTDLLRTDMGFEGLIVTDAMEMGGITRDRWSGQAAIEALAAGADMILLPPNPRSAHAAMVRAVRRGDLSRERLDEAVRKVLTAKARLGLTGPVARRPLAGLPDRFAPAADVEPAQRIADRAVTLLRDPGTVLPLDPREYHDVVVVGVSDSRSAAPTEALVDSLREALVNVRSYSIDGRTDGDEVAGIVSAAASASAVVLGVRVAVRTAAGTISLPDPQARYARLLSDLSVPTIVVVLGSPYAAAAFPEAEAVLTTYGSREPLQRAAAHAIVGRIPVRGRLPVSMPGSFRIGDGLPRPALSTALAGPNQTTGDSRPTVDLGAARSALERSVRAGAFPGAAWTVGWRSRTIGGGAVGRMTYAPDARPMRADSVFDLASLTKVVATTTVAMMAVERGDLRLDYPVRTLVPEFEGAGKERVTVRHLLTHTSGLPAYVQFFRDFEPGQAGSGPRGAVLERIYATDLEAPPGSRYSYSDLGIILFGELLDRALGEPYDRFAAREIFAPLGMVDTGWNPPADRLERIAPTEQDDWRGRLVRGRVHDRNAFVMGGVAPHAGLFSTAPDLAAFAQMLLNHGYYDGRRILQRLTVDRWRRRQEIVEGSSRALGWDTALGSERWGMFGPDAYGHTGFTGTSLWIDPERELFVVLLTNRVHPTRDRDGIIQARIDFHRAVVEAVDAAASR